jgi:hypothetical protein
MKIEFTTKVPVSKTMVFDQECFPLGLQNNLRGKRGLFKEIDHKVWMKVDGVLVGETYGCNLYDLASFDNIPGADSLYLDEYTTFYVYSTAIRPTYQGKGLGRILKAYDLGLLNHKYKTVIGHARTGASLELNIGFGAKIKERFDDWYDTGEAFYLYQLDL